MKKIIRVASKSVLIIIVIIFLYELVVLLSHRTVAPRNLIISDANYLGNNISLKGEVYPMDSFLVSIYNGYSVTFNNGALYVKIKSSLPHTGILLYLLPINSRTFEPSTADKINKKVMNIADPITGSADFTITFPNIYGKINQIYLQGDNPSDNLLIWPKK